MKDMCAMCGMDLKDMFVYMIVHFFKNIFKIVLQFNTLYN